MSTIPNTMSSRDYKNFIEGEVYHVFNRGNNKNQIFLENYDYNAILMRLKIILGLAEPKFGSYLSPLPPNSFSILSYCLMPNHFHFQIKQLTKIPVTKLMSKLWTSYAKYFNKKYNRVGHIFQDCFKANLINSDAYNLYLSAYIHNNPEEPADWEFSSLNEYLNPGRKNICSTDFILSHFNNDPIQYKNYVASLRKTPFLEGSLPDKMGV